jgi:hypothetical protein
MELSKPRTEKPSHQRSIQTFVKSMGGSSATTPVPPTGSQPAPLDVYKKITVIRDKDDCVVYEDSQGRLQRISNLGEEALSAVSDTF